MSVGDVVGRGTVPCVECRRPHDARVVTEADKHQGRQVSWMADDGHDYRPMSAAQVVEFLTAKQAAR